MSLTVKTAVHIARSPHDVFAFIAKPENLPRWDPAIRAVERKQPGPVGPGSELTVTAEEGGRQVTIDSHVTEFEADHLFGVAATFSGVPLRLRWRLEPEGSGTRLTTEGEAELRGVLALAGGYIKGVVTDRLNQAHENLKAVLENAPP
jgi:carbon monoxide dehydrogenase subunit G